MKTKTLAIGGLAAAGGAWLLRQRMIGGRWGGHVVSSDGQAAKSSDRWHAVTINRPPEEVMADDRLPGSLAGLADKIEVRTRPAPAGRGTELYARLRVPVPSGVGGIQARISGEDPRQSLRKALRETKMMLETGEVLSPDQPPTTKPTTGGKLVGIITSRARGEGLI